MQDDRYSELKRALQALWTDIKNHPAKGIGVLIVAIVLVIATGYLSAIGISWASKNASATATTTNIVGSNYNVGSTGTVTQTINNINQPKQPSITYIIAGPSKRGSDGLYHTMYEITFHDGTNVIAPTTFAWDKRVFTSCMGTGSPEVQFRPNSALINYFDCASLVQPPTDTILFWFPG